MECLIRSERTTERPRKFVITTIYIIRDHTYRELNYIYYTHAHTYRELNRQLITTASRNRSVSAGTSPTLAVSQQYHTTV